MISKIFFKQKPAYILAALMKKEQVWYPSALCKEVDCTYPHMINVLKQFEENDLIETESLGRIKIIKLTEFGEELAKNVNQTLKNMDSKKSGKKPKSLEKTAEMIEKEKEKGG